MEPKIGICLSGGGALGYAHVGVLQALEDNGIFPQVISGSSMGAIVGVLYAAGHKPESILQEVKNEKVFKISDIISPTLSSTGISEHKVLRNLLKNLLPYKNFNELEKEFYVCVSNLNKADWIIIGEGDLLHEYVVASASIPGIFEANNIGETTYVDGSLFNNLPAQILKDKCSVIIGVDVLPYYERKKITKKTEVLGLSIRAVEHLNAKEGRKLCDFLIESPAIEKFSEFSFDKYNEIIKIGYDTTIEYLKEQPELLTYAKK
jgi:NTE family protein